MYLIVAVNRATTMCERLAVTSCHWGKGRYFQWN